MTKPCKGPLHQGALVDESYFWSNGKETLTCRRCLDRNRMWKATHADLIKSINSWRRPEIRLKQNLRRLGAPATKKEALANLLKPGMGWSNYYVKGKRSWKFALVEGKLCPSWIA